MLINSMNNIDSQLQYNLISKNNFIKNNEIELFLDSTLNTWQNMYENHIHPLNILYETNILKHKITNYNFYKNNIIKPKIFILSQNIFFPNYDNDNDELFVYLLDKFFSEKSLIFLHTTENIKKENINVFDYITNFINNLTMNLNSIDLLNKISLMPIKNYFIKNSHKFYYETIKIGLINKNLKKILFTNARQIIIITNFLKKYKELFIEDIFLENSQRSKELKYILENEKNIFNNIWKNLELIIFFNNNGYFIETRFIKKYIVNNVKIYTPIYFNEFATIGYDIFMNDTFIIDTRKGFFEFQDIITHKIHDIRNVEINKLYKIIISSMSSNIVRYLTNDIIKIINNVKMTEIKFISNEINYLEILEIENLIMNYYPVDYCYRKNENKIIIYIELFDDNYKKITNKNYIIKIVRKGSFEKMYEKIYRDNIDISLMKIKRKLLNENLMSKNIIFVP